MTRKTSNSIMAPAIDRGASLRRPVVPGRSIPRLVVFALLFLALLATAVFFYMNRWRGENAHSESKAPTYRPLDIKNEVRIAETDHAEEQAPPPRLDAELIAELQSNDIDLSGLIATKTSAISPSGNFFAICDSEGSIRLFDFDGQNQRDVTLEHNTTALAFSDSGASLVLGFDNGEVALVDTAQGKIVHQRRAHRAAIASLAFLEDEGKIVSAAGDGYLRTLSSETLVEQSRTAFGEPIVDAAASSKAGIAWALGADGALRSYSLQGMNVIASVIINAPEPELAIAKGLGVVTLAGGKLCVRDPHSLEVNWSRQGFGAGASLSSQSNAVVLSDKRGIFLVSSRDGEIVGRRVELEQGIASISLSSDLSHGLIVDHQGNAHGLKANG